MNIFPNIISYSDKLSDYNHVNIEWFITGAFWNFQQISKFAVEHNINIFYTYNDKNKFMITSDDFIKIVTLKIKRKNYNFCYHSKYHQEIVEWCHEQNIDYQIGGGQLPEEYSLNIMYYYCTINNSIYIENENDAALFALTWGDIS